MAKDIIVKVFDENETGDICDVNYDGVEPISANDVGCETELEFSLSAEETGNDVALTLHVYPPQFEIDDRHVDVNFTVLFPREKLSGVCVDMGSLGKHPGAINDVVLLAIAKAIAENGSLSLELIDNDSECFVSFFLEFNGFTLSENVEFDKVEYFLKKDDCDEQS